MKCLKCQADNPDDKKFCRNCGTKLRVICPQCGSEISPNDHFCGDCGHDLRKAKIAPSIDYSQPQSYTPKFLADRILNTRSAIEGERKVMTVLFADVADSTTIFESLDPEDVHEIMDGCFQILMNEIHRREGTVNQFRGDGVMALFGAPVAHEDHAQRACYAALAIQNALKEYSKGIKERYSFEFKMRLGLNSGSVVVGSIGDDLRMDYTADGDTTNLAARIESAAESGTVLVSTNTYKLVKDFFEFEHTGNLQLKGKKDYQEAYKLIRSRDVATRIGAAVVQGLTRFVGRKNLIADLNEALEKTESGLGQVVGVVGEAGAGKSRLILELIQSLPKDRYTYLEGRCLHYGGTMAYLPVIEIVKDYFDIKDGESEILIKSKIRQKVTTLDEKLIYCLPPLQEILSIKVEDNTYSKLEHEQKREKLFEALRDLFVRESQNRPLIMVVDDLHWMDKMSEQFLDYLTGRLANARILLLLLYRPEYVHHWENKSFYQRINVDQLTYQSSVELIQAILGGCEIAPELQALILGRSSGNPLYMEELTKNLLENGSIKMHDNQCLLAKNISDIQVPDTIQSIIAARIDRIEENLKRIMQVASVIGREFAFRILQTITGMREDLKTQLLNLQGLEFIYEKNLFPELEYIFKHALTQEVAYNSLLVKRRKQIHQKIGEAIESLYAQNLEEYHEMLAYHYAGSDKTDKALKYLDLANSKSLNLCAMEEAKAYFEKAMTVFDALPVTPDLIGRRISLLVKQLWVFLQLGQHAQYYELLTRFKSTALELDDKGLVGAYYSRLATCELYFGELELSIQNNEKAIELCREVGNVEEEGNTVTSLQWAHLWAGNYDQVVSLTEVFLGANKQHYSPLSRVASFAATAMAHSKMGNWNSAFENMEVALKTAEEDSNNSLISYATCVLAYIQCIKGDSREALESSDFAAKKAPSIGNKVLAQASLAWAMIRSGEHNKGIELGSNLIPMFQAIRLASSEIWTKMIVGEGYCLLEDYGKATKLIEEAIKYAEKCGMRFFIGWGFRLLGEIALKTESDHAEAHFKKSIEVFQEIKAENELSLTYSAYGRFWKQQGNPDKAKECLEGALGIFQRLNTLNEADKVRKELDEIQNH